MSSQMLSEVSEEKEKQRYLGSRYHPRQQVFSQQSLNLPFGDIKHN